MKSQSISAKLHRPVFRCPAPLSKPCAPEVLAGRCDDFFVADDWSAGLVVLAMCCGQPSETDVRELHRGGLAGAEHFRAAVLKVQPLTHDVRVRALVARLLEPDPATRLSAEGALECEFVKGYA